MHRTERPPTHATRRSFVLAGAGLVVASRPATAAAAASVPTPVPRLSRAHRRTVRALAEADLPAGVPRQRIVDALRSVERRYTTATSASRAELERLIDALDDAAGRQGFAARGRDRRRALLRELGADIDSETGAVEPAVPLLPDVVLPRTPRMHAQRATASILDFAELPASPDPPFVSWEAQAADPGPATRADVSALLAFLRAALTELDGFAELI